MDYSDTERCSTLCIENGRSKEEGGCCWLKPGVGCAWMAGSHSVSGGSGLAVTCKKGKKNCRGVNLNPIFILSNKYKSFWS